MRVWLYSRLSRDEDVELNSLTNQQNIIREYAQNNNFIIVGESADDNISGMHFNREGINKIYEAVECKSIDAVIVKDMSRLGRHKTQTALFIDYLRENNVRVLSVTENLDTCNENDDLIIGFKGLFNDMYARDISRKVRAGFLQKQKEGLVMIPPMGYYKDKNTGEIIIMEEPATIVRKIFQLYIDGYGLKAIAKMLNDEGLKSPAYYQHKYLDKHQGYNKPEITTRYLWNGSSVKRTLQNEFYAGNLVNHKYYLNKITKVRKNIPIEEHIRHEGFVPAIVSKEDYDKVQFIMATKVTQNVRASSNKPYHRYTGLIKCGDCGASFCCKTRRWKDKPTRYEYVCNGYHRYGVENCSSHRINEETLDMLIYDELLSIKRIAKSNFDKVDKQLSKWLKSKSSVNLNVERLQNELAQRKSDQQNILLERLRDKERADIYTEMLEKCENDIVRITNQLNELANIEQTIKSRKSQIKSSIEIIDRIIDEGSISDSDLRMLVENIVVYETDGKLDIQINLNGEFRTKIDYYENGVLSEHIEEMWWYDDIA